MKINLLFLLSFSIYILYYLYIIFDYKYFYIIIKFCVLFLVIYQFIYPNIYLKYSIICILYNLIIETIIIYIYCITIIKNYYCKYLYIIHKECLCDNKIDFKFKIKLINTIKISK